MGELAEIRKDEKKSLVVEFANKYSVDSDKLLTTLKKTAFRQNNGEVTNEQMMALLVVANQYDLNPFTREIYAFPQNGGVVPIVPVDGWMKIINNHPNFDGMTFEDHKDEKGNITAITCSMYRKDRSHPIQVTEYMSECARGTEPWKKWPARMLRHKSAIQAARYAFSFSGIHDPDEGDRIQEVGRTDSVTSPQLGQFTESQKEYFDQLISNMDALGMYVFQQTLDDESAFANLYHSFEKGQKGKYQRVVDDLLKRGYDSFMDYVQIFDDACAAEDDMAIKENMADLSSDAMTLIKDKLAPQSARFIESIKD